MTNNNAPRLLGITDHVDAAVAARAEAIGQMTLGTFIAALEEMPHGAIINYHTGSHPSEPLSYRGYYNHLAFGYDGSPDTTVERVLAWARGAMGRTFEGYKGGDYVMHERTPVWSASYGTSMDGRRIVAVRKAGDRVAIVTVEDEDA